MGLPGAVSLSGLILIKSHSKAIHVTSTLHDESTAVAVGLATQLREGTQQVHEGAENTSFIRKLMGGELDTSAFGLLASAHYDIYRAMEDLAQELADHPEVGKIIDTDLHRLATIEADLEFFLGENWRDERVVLPATMDYVAAIGKVAAAPHRFIAHHYTRYLGDLSGGQAIARVCARHYQLTEAAPGLLFYHFPEIPKPKVYKDAYRQTLDGMELSAQEREEVVAESIEVFGHNTKVFVQLQQAFDAN